jgi:nucleotide-binding universal stress UspA family protein
MESTGNVKEVGTILVPVDYSPYSIQACRYAAKIANKSGSNICLFHAYYSPAFDLIELSGGLNQQQLRTDVAEKIIESEKNDMNVFIEALYKYKEISIINRSRISTELKAGLARDEIIAFSKLINPEIVVMGTRGADKKNNSILGSITEVVIKKLSVPVIAIPKNYKFVEERNLRKIVYLTNFDESDFVSIKKLMHFTELFNMSIHCIHIGSRDDKWELLKMEGLKDYFQKAYKKDSVECHILSENRDLLQAIDKYVIENDINLLALTHKKRKLLEKVFKPSITKKIFYHTDMPLLVFHGE